MKVLTLDPITAYLVTAGIIKEIIHSHTGFTTKYNNKISPRRIASQVAIRASNESLHPDQVDPAILDILHASGVTDTFGLPYKTIVGMADCISVTRIGKRKHEWVFSNPRRVVNPINDMKLSTSISSLTSLETSLFMSMLEK